MPGRIEQSHNQDVAVSGGQAIKIVLANAPVFHQPCLLELGEMGGDGALAHNEDFLQFRDGKLLALEQEQDAEPVGIGYYA